MKRREYNLFSGKRQQYRGTVTTIHGINTRGAWQKDVSPYLQDGGLRHLPADYGNVRASVLWSRRKAEEVILDAVEAQETALEGGPHTVIAHSFGTLALGRALRCNPDLELGRICLFGSILPRSFPWGRVREQYDEVLNEACVWDVPVWAAGPFMGLIGAGWSGCLGFCEDISTVHNRYYDSTGHSRLGSPLHCRKTWLPFLLDGTLPP